MLQRIQTIFLFMIVIAMCVFFFLPIWNKIDPTTFHGYTLYAWNLQEINPTTKLMMPYAVLGTLSVLIGLVAIYEIIRFDNRMLQLKLGALNSLLLTALLGTIVYLVTKAQTTLMSEIIGRYKIGFIMPVIGILNNLLANYFIRKDEKLIRSIDRIR